MIRLALLLLALAWPAAAQAPPGPPPAAPPTLAPPSLAAQLSVSTIEVTTAFTGGEILVFGATERLIGAQGDEVVVLATGPTTSLVVRQKVEMLGAWINGPSARFNRVPTYWALASTSPVVTLLDGVERVDLRLGLDLLPLVQLGARGPQFRAALASLKQDAGLWVDQVKPVEVSGGRLFHARLPLPATVATGAYQIQVMLVREGRVVARQELRMDVVRSGTAAWIADIARGQPVLYGLACILLAAFAGWVGSVLFRRG